MPVQKDGSMGEPGTSQDDDVRSRERLRPHCMDNRWNSKADRYDLSKQVDKLIIAKYSDGYSVKALLPNRAYPNEQTLIKDKMSESELSGAIGKDLAQKVIDRNSPLGQADVYEGIDLKVGGEGMKAFYDPDCSQGSQEAG